MTILAGLLGCINMNKIFLSIIIPFYNTKEEYFKGCLDSLDCKHNDGMEIIVVDDGSKDDYSNICQKVINSYKLNIRYYKKSNGGQNSARNYGLSKANGEYIYFVDSDDRIINLDEIIFLLKDKRPNILGVNMEILDGDYNIIDNINNWNKDYCLVDSQYAILHNASLCGQIYKKDIFNDISLIEGTKIGEDLVSSLLIYSKVKEEYGINKIIYQYIVRENSVITSPPKDSALDIIKSFDLLFSKLDKGFLNKYSNEFEWLAIKYVLIDGSHRINLSFNGNKEYLNGLKEWLFNNFPHWQDNPYLKDSKWSNNTLLKIKLRGVATRIKKYVK